MLLLPCFQIMLANEAFIDKVGHGTRVDKNDRRYCDSPSQLENGWD
jgi:hypothetical protein